MVVLCTGRLTWIQSGACRAMTTRFATTTATPGGSNTSLYPYPTHPRPTPHQIFHLPPGASQADVKVRYYELVRIHHPDSAHSRSLPPSERHTRFQSITAAYDVLQGKRRGGMPGDVGGGGSGPWGTSDPYMDELDRRRRAHYARHNRHAEYTHYTRHDGWTASADDRWKDRMILIVGIITLMAGIAPGLFIVPERMGKMHKAAVANLNQAREEARELGDERRSRMRERVKGMKCKNREAEEEQQLGEKAG